MQTAEPETPVPQAPTPDAAKTPAELFRYSTYLHVGPGAGECSADGRTCANPGHFHAWVRMPNQLQHSDIRQRALAAKARRMRQLRDPDSDSHEILENDLATLEREGDREALIDELVQKEWFKDHLDAMRELEELDEYEHLERDRERMAELEAMAPEDRPVEEHAELRKHLIAYGEKVVARRGEIQKPRHEALSGLSWSELVDLVRVDRIEADSSQEFMDVYGKWQWFVGTYKADRQGRYFSKIEELENAAPEVIDALKETFNDLEAAFQRGQTGN